MKRNYCHVVEIVAACSSETFPETNRHIRFSGVGLGGFRGWVVRIIFKMDMVGDNGATR